MATIPRSLLDSLTDEINALSGAGRQMVENALSRIVPMFADADGSIPNERVSDLRAAVCEVMETVCGEIADLSAARAAEFYDEVRVLSVGERLGARVVSGRDSAATDGAVRALVRSVVDTGSTDAFARGLAGRVDYETKRAANECVAMNAGYDHAKPTYARVPSGSETCPFCLMLASFGFHYRSPGAAAHAHSGCDCRVVPDFGDASIDGYDPDGMYEHYQDCLGTLGGREGIRAEWDALPEPVREAYVMSHGKKSGKAFDAYVNKRVSEEIATRDRDWFAYGIEPPITFETPKLEKEIRKSRSQELETADRLRKHGLNTDFIVDERVFFDEKRGCNQTVGLADLANGTELKTLRDASSFSTIDDYLRRTKKKEGVSRVVFDNADNKAMSDNELSKNLSKNRRYHGAVYIINHDKEYKRIR